MDTVNALPELAPSTPVDLHLHSSASDGRFTAREVLERCAAVGLEVVALTDHDLPPALEPGTHTIAGRTLHLIAGAELSGMHEGREFHLLVYFPGTVPAAFTRFCEERCEERRHRFRTALERLGLPLEHPPDARALTRLHLARLLVAQKRARSVPEAFRTVLGDSHGYVPPLSKSFVDALRFARDQGGWTSWAHPPRAAVEAHLGTFVAAGLQGLEVLRPRSGRRDRKALLKKARRFGLYVTGGSDWHGWSGTALGLFRVEAHQVAPFLERLRSSA